MIKIKSDFKDKVVAFKGMVGKTLGEQTPESLEKLALIAQESKDPSLLSLFEGDLASSSELKEAKVQKELKAISKEVPEVTNTGKVGK